MRLGATASQRLEVAVVLPRRHWPSYYNFTYLGAEAATVQPPEQRAASAGPHGLGSICLEDVEGSHDATCQYREANR